LHAQIWFKDGERFEGGTAENQTLEIGSNKFIPGFEEQLIGKNKDEEVEINVKFPEEYHSEDLAGKDAMFKVKIHEIKVKELPQLDDEFAKDVSEFDTLEELKKLAAQSGEPMPEFNMTETMNKVVKMNEASYKFLREYADRLRIREACNLLYRSRYATYQRVKFLNLQQMIGK